MSMVGFVILIVMVGIKVNQKNNKKIQSIIIDVPATYSPIHVTGTSGKRE